MRFKSLAMSFLATTLLAGGAEAQNLGMTVETPPSGKSDVQDQAKTYGFTNGGFVAAPIPLKNPTLGTGLALGGGYLFSMDEASSDSFLGLGGFKTDNGSYGYGLSGNISWGENQWNLGMSLGEVELNYDYFLDGSGSATVPLRQDGKLVNLVLKYGITPEVLVGLNTSYVESNLGLNAPGTLPPIFSTAANLKIFKFGPIFEIDKRDDTTYPTSGTLLALNSDYTMVRSEVGDSGSFTDDSDYFKSVAKYSAYASINEDMVVAAHATACSTSEDAPFFDKCGLGSVDSFRGFSFGEVLDNNLLSLQGEFRGRLTDRFGYVVFGGLGSVASDFSSMSTNNIRTAGGVGLRFRLSKKFPMDFSIDAARADTGTDAIYIYVGQRF